MEHSAMQVTSVEVTAMELDSGTGVCRGHVVFHDSAQSCVHFDCRAKTQDQSPDGLRAALTTDAQRQLLRMPEYRTGGRELVFLPGIAPRVQC